MANACACGCGELLVEGSTRQYKRGHKTRGPDTSYTETPVVNEDDTVSVDDIAGDIPDDPEPRQMPEYKPKANVRVTASVKRDIEGKLAFAFGMAGQTWSLADPVCGSVLMESGPAMAKAYMPLICQSPDMVRWLSKGGSFLLWADALMATWPLLQAIFAHHIARTISAQQSPNGTVPTPDYVVQ